MTQLFPRLFGRSHAGDPADPDAMRLPRRLIAAGAVAVFLLASALLIAARDSANRIDNAAIKVEMARAERAVAMLTRGDGTLSAEDVGQLDKDFALAGARLVPVGGVTESEVTISVRYASEGDGPRYLAWTPRRFGSEMFRLLAPRRMSLGMGLVAIIVLIFVWLSRTTRDLDRLRRAARELAIRDALTGLANRRRFEEILRRGPGDNVTGERLALFCLDLDDFKRVNDTMGHVAGDELLRSIGQRLAVLAGAFDLVARLGGDEFAIIRRERLEPEELAAFARSVILECCRPHAVQGQELSVGVSIGIAIAPDHAHSSADLLSRADAALYQAKAQAGPGYVFATCEAENLPHREVAARNAA